MAVTVDWQDSTPQFLSPYELPVEQKKLFPRLDSHFWLQTSGSSGMQKWVALSRDAIFSSATSVNSFIKASKDDIWGATLPAVHVGGLGIIARAYLSGSAVVDCRQEKWSPLSFLKIISEANVNLISLVPTQLHDLISIGARVPSSLRAVFVGGGYLSDELHAKGLENGWPLILTYGMTETASQICASNIGAREMKSLSHAQIRIEEGGIVSVNATSLFTGYGYLSDDKVRFDDPKENGWFKSSDLGELRNGVFHWIGRRDRSVKFKGILVNLDNIESELSQKFSDAIKNSFFVHAQPDSRTENKIIVVTSPDVKEELLGQLSSFKLQSFADIEELKVVIVPRMIRTTIGKWNRIATMQALS